MLCCDICGKEIKESICNSDYYDYKIMPESSYYADNRLISGISGRTCCDCGMDFLYKVLSIKNDMTKERWVGNGPKESD